MSTDPTSFVPDILDFEHMDNSSNNNFIDHIDDLLLDFPQQNAFVGGRGDSFPSVWNANPFSCFNPECSPELAAELSVPYEDAVQMEWLSAFVEDSYPNENLFRTLPVPRTGAIAPSQSHSRSPISVLESSTSGSSTSSSSSVSKSVKILPLNAGRTARIGYGRARTKRARPPTLNIGSTMQLISPAQSSPDTHYQKKKRSRALEKDDNETNPDPLRSGVRKCLHCEITETPQWRTGPLGPKTLCNACGVRHKSGRLYPEYRPAASPTFVPSLHSNSHKKVLEMRVSSSDKVSPPSTPIDSTA